MFALTNQPDIGHILLSMANSINPSKTSNKVFSLKISKDLYFHHLAVRPQDKLHVFKDALVVGWLDFNDTNQPSMLIQHEGCLGNLVSHSLIQHTVIRFNEPNANIRPSHQKNIYYSKKTVSDYQLLIAAIEGLSPSDLYVKVLGACGYLPGNMTLFTEVSKIPYLHDLTWPVAKTTQVESFSYQRGTNQDLIDRLKEVAPRVDDARIAMSGGTDSRFVLGILNRIGVKPILHHLNSDELQIVEVISKELGLVLEVTDFPHFDSYRFTLATDARIYHHGGAYCKMINRDYSNSLLFNGLWSTQTLSNAYDRVWKLPSTNNVFSDYIKFGLLNAVGNVVKGYREVCEKGELQQQLERELYPIMNYCEFKNRKQWAGWFSHINRGANWVPAHVGDVSTFIYPVFVLGDKIAAQIGITSHPFSNLTKSRSRAMTNSLLPSIKIEFSGGRPYKPYAPPYEWYYRINKEYLTSFKKYLKWQKMYRTGTMKKDESRRKDAVNASNVNLTKYFRGDLEDLIYNRPVPKNIQRAAVTVNNSLNFLDKIKSISRFNIRQAI